MTRKAVFLDRDGVLVRAPLVDGRPESPASAAEVEILPGVPEALARLRAAGFALLVVTNQPQVARGGQTREGLAAIDALLRARLPLDAISACCHDDADGCSCRKPAPGMLLEAAAAFGVDLAASYMVGDRWRDVEAGRRAGCAPVFVDRGYRERRPEGEFASVGSLPEAADWILAREARAGGAPSLAGLRTKIFADGADRAGMLEMYAKPWIKGFTTNPTLMCKAGVGDYRAFAREILAAIPDRPISFEVFSDEFPEMERQALEIAGWGANAYVKIPITNTRREPSDALVRKLSRAGVKVNVTAMMTLEQVERTARSLDPATPACVSVFAGRVADTGRDPVPIMAEAVRILRPLPQAELIWASPRELLNIFQADAVGCQIITVTNDILKKLSLVAKDLGDYSLDTVKMFRDDAVKACFKL